jgi:hypothetical protein
MRRIWMAGLLALAVSAGTLTALPAQASVSGRRNTAIGLGAAAIYELTQHNTIAGLALGAGAAYSYKRSQDEQRWENRYDRYGYGYRGSRYSGRWNDRDRDDGYRYSRSNYDRYDRHSGWHSRR